MSEMHERGSIAITFGAGQGFRQLADNEKRLKHEKAVGDIYG